MFTPFVIVEFGHSNQLVLSVLVCACRCQPIVGQLKCRFPPADERVIGSAFVGPVGRIVATLMLPSTARSFVHVAPPPVTVIALPPETGWLNSVNLSPTASVGPRLDTMTEPEPVLLNAPDTTVTSLDCACDLSTSMSTLPFSVRSPLTVSVPIELPGDTVPFARTLPVTVPLPPSICVTPSVHGEAASAVTLNVAPVL